jgi:hypothetical protein
MARPPDERPVSPGTGAARNRRMRRVADVIVFTQQ